MEYKIGDIVEHKTMKGKFVIIRRYSDDKGRGFSYIPWPDYELRCPDGSIMKDVFREELKN